MASSDRVFPVTGTEVVTVTEAGTDSVHKLDWTVSDYSAVSYMSIASNDYRIRIAIVHNIT